jgi:hypothetical protein
MLSLPMIQCGRKVNAMAKDTKPHDWNKEQPHHAGTGRFVKEDYARNNPNKVTWVKENNK